MDVWICGEYIFLIFMNFLPKHLRMRRTTKIIFWIDRNFYPVDTEDNLSISCSIKLAEGRLSENLVKI